MIQEYRNVTGNKIIFIIIRRQKQSEDADDSRTQKCNLSWNYLGNYKEHKNQVRTIITSLVEKCYWWVNDLYNYKEGDDKVRIMMTEEKRNLIAK